MCLAKSILNGHDILDIFISDPTRPQPAPFCASKRGDPPSREALTNVEETPASTYTTQDGFGLTFVPPFQARLKHRANEVNGKPPPSPGGPPAAGRPGRTRASSIRGGRCVLSHIGRQSRLTCPGKTAAGTTLRLARGGPVSPRP